MKIEYYKEAGDYETICIENGFIETDVHIDKDNFIVISTHFLYGDNNDHNLMLSPIIRNNMYEEFQVLWDKNFWNSLHEEEEDEKETKADSLYR